MTRSRRPHTSGHSAPKRKSTILRLGHTFTGAATATAEAWDVTADIQTLISAIPQGMTLGPGHFDLGLVGTGTGTGLNSVTLGFIVGPSSLDALDMDPVSQANFGFWWLRKFYVQNNSNPAGEAWAVQGVADQFRINTRRRLEALKTSLFCVARPDFTGFTALATTVDLQMTLLYP
jgi:hypothetical protein